MVFATGAIGIRYKLSFFQVLCSLIRRRKYYYNSVLNVRESLT
jgi:hypothetical protein